MKMIIRLIVDEYPDTMNEHPKNLANIPTNGACVTKMANETCTPPLRFDLAGVHETYGNAKVTRDS